jgi:glycosyltransferase involved in cell wall biosynthesis
MRITYIAAGAGDNYCGACARDAVLVRGLLRAGHDVHMIPLYTPLKLEDDSLPLEPVFFGGINVFLQQASAIFRHMPRFLDRVLDSRAILRFVSRYSIEVDPKKLGPMTVSVLAGSHGRQKKEMDRLLAYLKKGPRPDVVNLTNSLLSALAPEIKKTLHVPVVCTFQGEDIFVSDLPAPYRTQARDHIRRNARSIDLFICPNQCMLDDVATFLDVSRDRLHVVRTAVETGQTRTSKREPFTVGYLSAIKPGKGLDILLDAMRILVHDRGFNLRLRIAGRVADQKYWRSLQPRIKSLPADYLGEVDTAGRSALFAESSLLALPSRYAEPRGVAALEAMAACLPVLVPDTGVFREIAGLGPANGLITIPSHDPKHWADAIQSLVESPSRLERIGRDAYAVVTRHCSPDAMVRQTLALYAAVASAPAAVPTPV